MSYLYNNQVGFVPTSTDAFGRLTVANPFTLFDSSHRYRDNGLCRFFMVRDYIKFKRKA